MTSWFVLFFVQTSLIAAHRVALRKRLGIFGAALAGLIVIVGVAVALHAAVRDMNGPTIGGPPPLSVLGFFLFVLLVFAVLVGAALLLRRRRESCLDTLRRLAARSLFKGQRAGRRGIVRVKV